MIALAEYLDAIKIDLKGFTEDFYQDYCGGRLAPVLETIKRIIALGKWLEVVYLVIPTVNDDTATIRSVADWLRRAGGADVPLHFSRFHPSYRLTNLPPTPETTLRQCRKTALESGLNYVYIGNVPGTDIASTYCPGCGSVVVKRTGFEILANHVKANGACKFCGHNIAGIWA
jgi:pyruvate formate lyase activating enzyme